jgi:hypothetical protein
LRFGFLPVVLTAFFLFFPTLFLPVDGFDFLPGERLAAFFAGFLAALFAIAFAAAFFFFFAGVGISDVGAG